MPPATCRPAPAGRLLLALDATGAEAPGHDDAVRLAQNLPGLVVLGRVLNFNTTLLDKVLLTY